MPMPSAPAARSACTARPWARSWWWATGRGVEEQPAAGGVGAERVAEQGVLGGLVEVIHVPTRSPSRSATTVTWSANRAAVSRSSQSRSAGRSQWNRVRTGRTPAAHSSSTSRSAKSRPPGEFTRGQETEKRYASTPRPARRGPRSPGSGGSGRRPRPPSSRPSPRPGAAVNTSHTDGSLLGRALGSDGPRSTRPTGSRAGNRGSQCLRQSPWPGSSVPPVTEVNAPARTGRHAPSFSTREINSRCSSVSRGSAAYYRAAVHRRSRNRSRPAPRGPEACPGRTPARVRPGPATPWASGRPEVSTSARRSMPAKPPVRRTRIRMGPDVIVRNRAELQRPHPDLFPRFCTARSSSPAPYRSRVAFTVSVAKSANRASSFSSPPVSSRVVPESARLLPGVAAEGGGGQVEGMVGDAGVDVHTAVVAAGADVVLHGRGPGPCRGRRRRTPCPGLHRAQGHPVTRGASRPAPISFQSASAAVWPSVTACNQRAEDVGERLVERFGLAVVLQVRGVLGDAEGQLPGAMASTGMVKSSTSLSPSPNTICSPFQKALS